MHVLLNRCLYTDLRSRIGLALALIFAAALRLSLPLALGQQRRFPRGLCCRMAKPLTTELNHVRSGWRAMLDRAHGARGDV